MMRLLPLRAPFDRRLAEALAEAARAGQGFYLGGFAARRALGASLLVDTDPRRISHRLRHRVVEGGRIRAVRDRFVGAGDWTGILDPLTESSTHREAQEVVAAGLDFRKTESFRRALQRAGGPKPAKRNCVALKTPALVERYFGNLAELARSIAESGVVRRSDYRRAAHLFADFSVRRPWIEAVESDIGIAIGAQGEVYRFASGKHRTAIAQALGLASIPVEVRLVHADWLERQVAETGDAPAEALLRGIRSLNGVAP